ncbi:hypothetical protein KUCAC02_013060 [Chaenocephalus aceratus]|uniref:Uncharacterized protein n=1 Tax=Chaenocephalus aceratus TaxID=36190 RepID=A0ACB9XCG6_CHAAC|nr:hypothetical protein KUCAC02_013060 [Chaenocephalus aceratus]
MSKSSKSRHLKKGPETRGKSDMEALLADTVLEKLRGYLDSRFDQLQQMGRETEGKLTSIQTDLMVLSESIGTVKAEMGKIRLDVVNNSGMLATHEDTLDMMQLKLADMEDRSRRCNVRNLKGELMRAHRIYSDDRKKQVGATRTLIFNVLRYTTRQDILRAAKKAPLTIDGRRIHFSPDYSSYTVKRRQAFLPGNGYQPAGTRDLGARLTANSGLLEPAGLYSVAVLD